VPGDTQIKQLLTKIEHEYSVQQMRNASSSPVKNKLNCRSISIKEVFEICDHSELVANVLTDYMEVVVTADKGTEKAIK
jgi:hypothetical protein